MKKQNPENKLVFNKAAVAELNEGQLNEVNGGFTTTTIGTTSTIVITIIRDEL